MTTAGYLIPLSETHRLKEFVRSQQHLIKSGVTEENLLNRNLNAFLDTLKTYDNEPQRFYIHYKTANQRSKQHTQTFKTSFEAEQHLDKQFPGYAYNAPGEKRWSPFYEVRNVRDEPLRHKPKDKPTPTAPSRTYFTVWLDKHGIQSQYVTGQYSTRPEAEKAIRDYYHTLRYRFTYDEFRAQYTIREFTRPAESHPYGPSYTPPQRYEIYHTGTNRPAAFFKGHTFFSRLAADQAIRDKFAATTQAFPSQREKYSKNLAAWLSLYEARIKA